MCIVCFLAHACMHVRMQACVSMNVSMCAAECQELSSVYLGELVCGVKTPASVVIASSAKILLVMSCISLKELKTTITHQAASLT